jgi:hypothetical protein
MGISPGGSLGIFFDVFVTDVQSAQEADASIDEQDLAVVALAWPEAPEPLGRRVELDDAGTGTLEAVQSTTVETVGPDRVEDQANVDTRCGSRFERREHATTRLVGSQDVGLEMNGLLGTIDCLEHGIDRLSATIV